MIILLKVTQEHIIWDLKNIFLGASNVLQINKSYLDLGDWLKFLLEQKNSFEDIYEFNNENSNQQLRFITMIDIFYEKKIRLTLTLEENLNNFSSSNKHSEVFKRTISRVFQMTKSP